MIFLNRIPSFQPEFRDFSFFEKTRFVFVNEGAPAPVAEQADRDKKAPEKKEEPSTPDQVDGAIRAQAMGLIDKAEKNLNALLRQETNTAAKKEGAEHVNVAITLAREGVERATEYGLKATELMLALEEHLAKTKTTLELKLEVRKVTENSPMMKELYDQLQQKHYGPSRERLLLAIDNIFKEEKNPDIALRRAQSEMMKESILDRCRETPAKSTDVIDFQNHLGREQMMQVLNLIGIDFGSLDISAEQMNKLDAVSDIRFHFEGATYGELGLLDANGNIQKAGLENLFNHEKNSHEFGPAEAEFRRRDFGRNAGLNLALQATARERYKESGRLPTITLGGRSFDLNEITAESEKEFNRFARQFDQSPPVEKMNEEEKQKELPTTIKALLEYRFDKIIGANDRVSRQVPSEIKKRLEALGLQNPDISVGERRIRSIRFEYKGEKMEMTIGRYEWKGNDQRLFLHIANDKRMEVRATEIKDLNSLPQELDGAKKYREDNQQNLDTIEREYFKTTSDGYHPSISLRHAKETYLGSLVPPRGSEERPPKPETIQALNKILPMILANADALGINMEMSLSEALLKIHQSPDRDKILGKDYSVFLAEMKKPKSRVYAGFEPEYGYDYREQAQDIAASRTNTNSEFLARKETLAKMKPGDKMQVEFEGKKYTFVLISKLGNFDYRFKLEGHDLLGDFNINNTNLIRRSPEQQLQYMMGRSWTRSALDTERLLSGKIRPSETPKKLSIEQDFSRGKLLIHPYFKNLPLKNEQRQLLENINNDEKIRLTMHTDKYGKVAFCEVRWQDEQSKTSYRLSSDSGNYWRLSSLENKGSRTNYLFYDVDTPNVGPRIKPLTARSSA